MVGWSLTRLGSGGDGGQKEAVLALTVRAGAVLGPLAMGNGHDRATAAPAATMGGGREEGSEEGEGIPCDYCRPLLVSSTFVILFFLNNIEIWPNA